MKERGAVGFAMYRDTGTSGDGNAGPQCLNSGVPAPGSLKQLLRRVPQGIASKAWYTMVPSTPLPPYSAATWTILWAPKFSEHPVQFPAA